MMITNSRGRLSVSRNFGSLICLVICFVPVAALSQKAVQDKNSKDWWKADTHLVISGGRVNFPRVSAWLLNAIYDQFPHGKFSGEILYTGSAYATELKNVERGIAQVAVTTPTATVFMAYNGTGLFSKPNPNLRGLFKIGQGDFLTVGVPESSGATTFEDIIKKKIPLKIAAGFVDGDSTEGFALSELFKAYGSSLEDFRAWGGQVMSSDSFNTPGLKMILEGRADSIVQEQMVVTTPMWKQINEKTPMRMLSIRPDIIADFEKKYGFHKFELKKGSFPGVLEDVTTLDYPDWIVVGDAKIPDELAYKIAKAAAENGPAFNRQDPSIIDEKPGAIGNFKLNPATMWKDLGAPLHPGAARYYKEKGLMP